MSWKKNYWFVLLGVAALATPGFWAACEDVPLDPVGNPNHPGGGDGDTDSDADGDTDADADVSTDTYIEPAVCGDGIVQSESEECDDGNTASSDGCSKTCQLEPGAECPEPGEPCVAVCGDGLVGPGEECDDGVNDGGYGECAPGCVLGPYCGDGILQAEYEECDNGGEGAECSSDCHLIIVVLHCGDGVLQPEWEECDDGNTVPDDGCSETCEVEPGAECSEPGEPCVAICGDGLVGPGEECDDGVNDGGYGECAPDCVLGPYCGDAIIQSEYETCDDGVNDGKGGPDTQGCSSDCQIIIIV